MGEESGMNAFEVFLPGNPPNINHCYQHTKAGKHFLTAEAKAWIGAAANEVALAVRRQAWTTPATGTFDVLIEHTAKRQDVDGCAKIVLDTVSRALGFDDKLVRELTIRRVAGEPHGVGVRIWLSGAEPRGGE
jgi:Holliday junction resolvase RusA-like endonuclease